MKTKYEEIVNVKRIAQKGPANLNKIMTLAKTERIRTASQDSTKRLLLCIDIQKDFMEGGALPVPNSIEDVKNITHFIYDNIEEITKIVCSMDTHYRTQIFYPSWWINKKGLHPEPYTIITYDDVIAGKWKPINEDGHKTINYLKTLKKNGKKPLCIWPYHCLRGSDGYTLENEFAKMVRFHSSVRITKTEIIRKGMDPFSEMYGIISPEYSETPNINMQIIDMIEEYDEIYVAGEAASHCVSETLQQIVEHFAKRPEIIKKITVLTDCTSPIKGFEDETSKLFDMLRKKYGIKFKKSTEIHFEK